MASAISSAARALTTLCDTIRVVEACEKMFQAQDAGRDTLLEKASVVNRLISLGFTIAEVGMVISGSKSEALSTLKKIELLPRILDLQISILLEASKADGSWRSIVRIFEKGFMAPMADIVRVGAEGQAYDERYYLEMSPDEAAKAQRPIYEMDTTGQGITFKLVGYKPVDLQECRKNLERLEKVSLNHASARYLCETGVLETLAGGIPLYERLFRYFRAPQQPAPLVPAAAAPAAPPPVNLDAFLAINFQQYPRIPDPLHNDEVFRQFICPITGEPIRDPVRDPTNNRTLYERTAIVHWLRVHPTSPMTRVGMRVDQLIEVPGVRAVIDQRLAHHRDHLLAYLQNHLNDAVPPADQAVIEANA